MSRMSRWDRRPAPKDFRWYLRLLGKVLICAGLLMFGFVAYQLWGTGIQYARAQNQLNNEFDEVMAQFATSSTSSTSTTTSPATTPTSTTLPQIIGPDSSAITNTTATPTPSTSTSTSTTTTPTTTSTIPPPTTIPNFSDVITAMAITEGSVVGRIEIPAMELDDIIVAGVEREQLADGPGLYPQTPMPGQLGNSAIAGHRTTHGQPFYDINNLVAGDEIIVTVPYGRFVYIVTSFEIVAPSATQVIATTDPTRAMLTLTSCHPRYSASQRYIVYADLHPTQSQMPGQPILNFGRDLPLATNTAIPGDDPTVTATVAPTVAPTEPPTTPPVGPVVDSSGATLLAETTAAATTTTTAVPATTAAPDPLYTVNPGGGTTRGDGGDSAPADSDDALSNRWFSDKDAFVPVATWAVACAAIVVGAYQLAKLLRNSWIGLAAGVLPFVVGLYFFYENVNRLLPAAL